MAAQITSPAGPSAVSVSSKTTPLVSHLDMPVAGDEYTLVIPAGVKSFRVTADNQAKLLIATTALGTQAGDDNYPEYAGFEWKDELLAGTNALTFYVSSNKTNTKLKLLTWT